jgi:hypothetical protein
MELEATPHPPLEELERVRGVDLAVCFLSPEDHGRGAAAAALVRGALEKLAPDMRAVLIVGDGAGKPHIVEEQSLPVLYCRLSQLNDPQATPQNAFFAFRTALNVSAELGVRACGVFSSALHNISPQWIGGLVHPVLEGEFELVAPRYARHKWEGLITRCILSPLSRALYGPRLQCPAGPDFGLSGKLLEALLANQQNYRANSGQPMISVVSAAVSSSARICEAELGARRQPPADWTNLSSLLAEILGAVFLDVEKNVTVWQRVRATKAVPSFGTLDSVPEDGGSVDVRRLVDSFHLGAQNLQDIWSLVLPPTALLEIRKLSRLPMEDFRMPDELWASIVYDFALAHRIRNLNRDHLLRSLTPLYLAWIASYALQMETADNAAVERKLERLALAYESGKSYLMSRWRWPDRFNP